MSTVAGRKLHGQNGAVFIQGFAASAAIPTSLVNLAVKKWTGNHTWKEHDTGSTSVPNYESAQKGKQMVKFTIDAQLDVTQLPLGASGVDLQADYCSLVLVHDQTNGGTTGSSTPATGGQTYNIPVAIVTDIQVTSAENDIINYTITGRSSGAFTINSGS